MKKLFIAYFFILTFCFNSFAALRVISLNELIEGSDLIVIGTLQSVSEYSYNGVNDGEGRILIEQVIAGNVRTNEGLQLKSGDKLKLIWREDFACVYGSHRKTENQKGVWFLKVESNGTVTTELSTYFKSLNELAEVKNVLEEAGLSGENIKFVNISERNYSTFNAFLVILTSLFLYYFLYRSRFKIR